MRSRTRVGDGAILTQVGLIRQNAPVREYRTTDTLRLSYSFVMYDPKLKFRQKILIFKL
jgi:hypothetical protein